MCVEVGSRRGQDAVDGDTEGQGYQGQAFSPCPMGEAGLKRHLSAWKARVADASCTDDSNKCTNISQKS